MCLKTIKILILLLVLSFLGCNRYDIGSDFNDAFVSKIQKNVTTKEQIRTNVGEPHSVTTTMGMESWTYQYTNAYATAHTQAATFGLVKEKPTNKTLIIMFQGDKVAEYNYTR